MSENIGVVVTCDSVKLKLTCTPALLERPLSDCIITPFLGAYNKKKGTTLTASQLTRVEVDGTIVSDLDRVTSAVLGNADAPQVTLWPPCVPPDPNASATARAPQSHPFLWAADGGTHLWVVARVAGLPGLATANASPLSRPCSD